MEGQSVLGIDPGTAIMGYGIVTVQHGRAMPVAFGSITTPPDLPESERLFIIHNELCRIVACHRPSVMAVERLFFNKNVRSAFAVGQARGVALLVAATLGLRVAEYTPIQVKSALTGQGRADKGQVGYMVRVLLGLDSVPEPDDVADALAVAICHANHSTTEARLLAAGRSAR